jgi:hypothetical protein
LLKVSLKISHSSATACDSLKRFCWRDVDAEPVLGIRDKTCGIVELLTANTFNTRAYNLREHSPASSANAFSEKPEAPADSAADSSLFASLAALRSKSFRVRNYSSRGCRAYSSAASSARCSATKNAASALHESRKTASDICNARYGANRLSDAANCASASSEGRDAASRTAYHLAFRRTDFFQVLRCFSSALTKLTWDKLCGPCSDLTYARSHTFQSLLLRRTDLTGFCLRRRKRHKLAHTGRRRNKFSSRS